jgi:hypothetical protein
VELIGVARATHSSSPRILRVCIENVGKRRLDEDSKFQVNRNDEGIGARTFSRVIPGREWDERTRNLEIPGLVLRTIPE